MTFRNKYIKKVFSAYLLFYIFFIVFAALHTHNSNIQSGIHILLEQSSSSSKTTDPFADENFNCQLFRFTNTTYLLNPPLEFSLFYPGDYTTLKNAVIDFYIEENHFNFQLRAPPTFS